MMIWPWRRWEGTKEDNEKEEEKEKSVENEDRNDTKRMPVLLQTKDSHVQWEGRGAGAQTESVLN